MTDIDYPLADTSQQPNQRRNAPMKGKTKTKKPTGLQSEPQGMTFADFDAAMEQPVLEALAKCADGATATELFTVFYGAGCSGKRAANKVQAKSWARNALRRPYREGFLLYAPATPTRRAHWRLSAKGEREVHAALDAANRDRVTSEIVKMSGTASERRGPKSAAQRTHALQVRGAS